MSDNQENQVDNVAVEHDFAVGDVAVLKSGGPDMAVVAVDGDTIKVEWNEGTDPIIPRTGEFPAATLVKKVDDAGKSVDGGEIDAEGNYLDAEGNLFEAGSPEALAAVERLSEDAPPAGDPAEDVDEPTDGAETQEPPKEDDDEDNDAEPENQGPGADAGIDSAAESPNESDDGSVADEALLARTGDEQEEPESESDLPVEVDPRSLQELRAFYKGKLPEDALLAWDEATLRLYHETRAYPNKTVRGNWPSDIRRTRDYTSWKADEILDTIDGNLPMPKGDDKEQFFDEVYRRFRLPDNWTHEAAVKFIKTHEKPEVTSSGLLKEDRFRALKDIGDWTYLELRAAIAGEIEAPWPEAELIEAAKKVLDLPQSYGEETLVKSMKSSPEEATMSNVILRSKLDEYAAHMSRTLPERQAAKGQEMLYRQIRLLMAREPAAFHEGWIILLDFVDSHYSRLFTPASRGRGWPYLEMGSAAIATFEDLMSLIIATRSPARRLATAATFNFETILRHITKENERQNLVHFYKYQGQ